MKTINEIKIDGNVTMFWVTFEGDFVCYSVFETETEIGTIKLNLN